MTKIFDLAMCIAIWIVETIWGRDANDEEDDNSNACRLAHRDGGKYSHSYYYCATHNKLIEPGGCQISLGTVVSRPAQPESIEAIVRRTAT